MVSVLVLTVLVAGQAVVAPIAEAWKPYTHLKAAESSYADAVADGSITIDGHDYQVDSQVVDALRNYRGHYNAGVVGPDAFPDLTMGQGVIHPSDTGKWLEWIFNKAWDAQSGRNGRVDGPDAGQYTAAQQGQILAFAYGFLTHAAGDVWAHTFVNEFAEGVFPDLESVGTDSEAAKIALRHVVVEGYVGDATPGYDGNTATRSVIPNELNSSGNQQVSNVSTPDISFAPPPNNFIWEVFIERPKVGYKYLDEAMPGQPTAARGPMIEGFFQLHNRLIDQSGSHQYRADRAAACIAAIPTILGAIWAESKCGSISPASIARRAYLYEWALDIEKGLKRWGEVGMIFTALFDPGVLRAAQDSECRNRGSEYSLARQRCENEIGSVDAAIWYADSRNLFTTRGPRLASMLGAPDLLLAGYSAVESLVDAISFPNPLRKPLEQIEDLVEEFLYRELSDALGFDLRLFEESLEQPGQYLTNGGYLPSEIRGNLFAPDTINDVDRALGFDSSDRTSSGRLNDDAEFKAGQFAAFENTMMLSKLSLLSGTSLNALLSRQTGHTINLYGPNDNIMIKSLSGGPWLEDIDSNDQWRFDPVPGNPSVNRNGGTGQMPLWESCLLRPAFRSLFTDWQHGNQNFPDLGDVPAKHPDCSDSSNTNTNTNSGSSDSDCVDSDGDGYGWIQARGETCLVGDDSNTNTNTNTNTNSGSSDRDCVDSDGDGYGWIEATRTTCLVGDGSSNTNSSNTRTNTNTNTNSGSADDSCVDSDGDGYGWIEATRTTCRPALAAVGAVAAEIGVRAALGNCDYTQAARFNGYGWDPVAKKSCPPRD